MSLPKLELNAAPGFQKERLARWLAAWEIDLDLRAAGSEPGGPHLPSQEMAGEAATEPPCSPVSDEPAPGPGQIRLFSPEVPAARDRLLYVALLAVVADGRFLIVPCGRFSEPCVPGELLTGRDAASLAVLCLWNTVEVPGVLLTKSWVIDELTGKELDEAFAVRRCLLSEEELLPDLARRVGPPLWHPADPRRRYLAEERQTMQRLTDDSDGAVRYPLPDSAWPIAADPHAPYEADLANPDAT